MSTLDVGDVDIPECSERVGDDLILDPPDCRVYLLLFKIAAISLHRGSVLTRGN